MLKGALAGAVLALGITGFTPAFAQAASAAHSSPKPDVAVAKAFVDCLRKHGVDVPDPVFDKKTGEIGIKFTGKEPEDVLRACKQAVAKLAEGAGKRKPTEAEAAKLKKLKEAELKKAKRKEVDLKKAKLKEAEQTGPVLKDADMTQVFKIDFHKKKPSSECADKG
jgi:hypothetical protein